MLDNVHHRISSCSACAQAKVLLSLAASKLLPMPMLQMPWSKITVDFIIDLLESQGHITILVTVDWFSKSLHLIPLPGLPTAFTKAKLFFNHIFRHFGIPEDIVSDRGTQFTS